ncbi:aldehyde dehydrogenase [Alicycliphilus denitrificans]|uniref:4-(hydroxymethyl)benzenesulfonate dehydrogenase n=1 Tax=Alicycliphilus denitrificans TaxID=179636 RepID=A0A858ZNQ6_9BURK|nr:aldehyde dehydrogenase [Alicycliphilus denitrificans]QKD42418.1 aldehyde dehydrogenase [Alicycliphilus denitrificans]
MLEHKPMLIAGKDAPGEDGIAPLVSVNPATGATNHEVAAAGPRAVGEAVRSAAQACKAGAWTQMLPMQRARILFGIADRMERDGDHLARLQMLENGKVWSECVKQVKSAAATFRYYGAVCETTGSEVTPARGNYLSMTAYEPYGVVAAITPWNSPLTMEAQKIAPALAAGNAVVLKPSEVTPSTGLAVGRIALEAGLPPGLLNVLPGTGHDVGAALVAHPLVRMVSFTGGTESGRRIAEVAARKLMPVALELGGKSPHIVFADADIDAAVAAVADGIFEGSGQSCVAGSRLFVQRSVHDAVVRKLVERARSLRVDLPDAAGAEMGPLATFAHRDKVERMVEDARTAGAQILAGGARPGAAALARGAYYLPTVIGGIDNRAAIAQQEIFGPVLCVLPFDDEEDLIAQANDSAFGLASGVWTADYQRAWRVARALEAGTVWINTYKQLSISTPFGGFKESGIGREKGASGMRLYQQPKGIYFGMA